jgi:hypothetical protein
VQANAQAIVMSRLQPRNGCRHFCTVGAGVGSQRSAGGNSWRRFRSRGGGAKVLLQRVVRLRRCNVANKMSSGGLLRYLQLTNFADGGEHEVAKLVHCVFNLVLGTKGQTRAEALR